MSNDNSTQPSIQNQAEERNLGEGSILTIHRVLELFCDKSSVPDLLHKDLFDSRQGIVTSALSALGKIGNQSSLKHIVKLFTHSDESIQGAAIHAAGEIGNKSIYNTLLMLFKTTQNEELRCEILQSLSKISPREQEVVILVREYARSQIVSPATRAFATGLLLKLDGVQAVKEILSDASEEVIGEVYRTAENRNELAAPLISHGIAMYHRMSQKNRISLVSIASPFAKGDSDRVLSDALNDPDPEVRRALYQVIGIDHEQIVKFDAIVRFFSERTENEPTLEEEVYGAMTRMEECLNLRGGRRVMPLKGGIISQIKNLFTQMSATDHRIISDSHELGWLITRSKEYLEYYADEEFKNGLVRYFKGSGNYTEQDLLRSLKNSAVKVEVRHFEGYNTLAELIKNPKRHGIALVARELVIARLGKKEIMYRLIRNLRLSRLFQLAGDEASFSTIYDWAKGAKLYRLADAALYALAKVDKKGTTSASTACITPPIASKILAIGSIHMLNSLDWVIMEPAVNKLILDTDDQHILLNLVDALSAMDRHPGGNIIKSLLAKLRLGNNHEILSRIAVLLGGKADFNIFDSLKEIFTAAEEWKRGLVLLVIERMIAENKITNLEGLSEFLYGILRGGGDKNLYKAAILLWKMGDEYALKILEDLIKKGSIEEKVDIVRGLKEALKPEIIHLFVPLFYEDSNLLQEALQETLLSAGEDETKKKILDIVRNGMEAAPSGMEEYAEEEREITADFQEERKAYRFEREHIQKLAVFFTDIQGYSKKAQELSSMELTSLIQEYEGILLPVVTSHHGSLIKKMGDGHLLVFQKPLNAVLAGVRVQKSLQRFNSYREEKKRVTIRVGIHWGDVARREGDVFGNNVNIASRLESSAKGGSILISKALQEDVKDHIHSREIGLINVKGIKEPISVYEPYEIAIDLPEELDPLKKGGHKSTLIKEEKPGGLREDAASARIGSMNQEIIRYFTETISSINSVLKRVEAGKAELGEVRKELARRWIGLKSKFGKEAGAGV